MRLARYCSNTCRNSSGKVFKKISSKAYCGKWRSVNSNTARDCLRSLGAFNASRSVRREIQYLWMAYKRGSGQMSAQGKPLVSITTLRTGGCNNNHDWPLMRRGFSFSDGAVCSVLLVARKSMAEPLALL